MIKIQVLCSNRKPLKFQTKDVAQARQIQTEYKTLKQEYETMKGLGAQLKSALARIAELEKAKESVETKLKSEMDEKVDLVTEKSRLEERLKTMEQEKAAEAEKLAAVMLEVETLTAHSADLERVRAEVERIEKEREQEQQAYQQLLRKFHDNEAKVLALEQVNLIKFCY